MLILGYVILYLYSLLMNLGKMETGCFDDAILTVGTGEYIKSTSELISE